MRPELLFVLLAALGLTVGVAIGISTPGQAPITELSKESQPSQPSSFSTGPAITYTGRPGLEIAPGLVLPYGVGSLQPGFGF